MIKRHLKYSELVLSHEADALQRNTLGDTEEVIVPGNRKQYSVHLRMCMIVDFPEGRS